MSYSNPNRYFDHSKAPYRKAELRCELCDRTVPALTAHHLTPRQKTKRKNLDPSPTIQICSACHRQIHAFYDNTHLAKELNSLEKLQQDPKMQKFIAWVRKQSPEKRVQVDRR